MDRALLKNNCYFCNGNLTVDLYSDNSNYLCPFCPSPVAPSTYHKSYFLHFQKEQLRTAYLYFQKSKTWLIFQPEDKLIRINFGPNLNEIYISLAVDYWDYSPEELEDKIQTWIALS